MANFRELKETVLLRAITDGEKTIESADVPSYLIRRWKKQLTIPMEWGPRPPSYVNHFMLGADPEFAMEQPGERLITAAELGMHTGAAFGADGNGRIFELRCHPSRSALKVVASTLATLRYFYMHVQPRNYRMWTSPLAGRDGLGGHVHFGRKRYQLRTQEVKALDKLAEILQEKRPLFQPQVVRDRRAATGYGEYRDTREQNHGYEYRTLPTWLGSPAVAFLVITLSKLFVFKPELEQLVPQTVTVEFIRRLFGYFQLQDHDANIAMHLLTWFAWMPPASGGGFMTWGLEDIPNAAQPNVFPSSIKPSKADVAELLTHLKTGVRIPNHTTGPTWLPITLPKGYRCMLKGQRTAGLKGVGEIFHGLVTMDKALSVIFKTTNDHGANLIISPQLKAFAGAQWTPFRRTLHPGIMVTVGGSNGSIHLSHGLRESNLYIKSVRDWLAQKVLPICRIEEASPPLLAKWQTQLKATVQPEVDERILFND